MSLKLYTVVDHRLKPGAKAAQSAHALAALAQEHPYEFRKWGNKTIVMLETVPGVSVTKLAELAGDGEFKYSTFTEPDGLYFFDDSPDYMSLSDGHKNLTTAIAFAPNWLVQNVLIADLPTTLGGLVPAKKGWFR